MVRKNILQLQWFVLPLCFIILSGFGEAMPENEVYLQTGAPTIFTVSPLAFTISNRNMDMHLPQRIL